MFTQRRKATQRLLGVTKDAFKYRLSLLLSTGSMSASAVIAALYVFVLAAFLGYQVISRVPPLLHTPLMSATNAISGISLVGSIVIAGSGHGRGLDDSRFHCRRLRQHKRRRRICDHGSDAEDVQAEEIESVSTSVVSLLSWLQASHEMNICCN